MSKKKLSFNNLINSWGHLNFRRQEECATLVEWLSPQAGEQILDIGCGNGYNDMIIARSGAKVVGIDVLEKPLAMAKQMYESDRVSFQYLNAEAMNFPHASFDKVISFCVIEHLTLDQKVIQDVHRLLKPGGSFVFSADSLSNPGITEKERSYHQKRYAVNTFYTLQNVTEKLSRAGFEILEHRYILNTPLALRLVRFSWKLDRLPKILGLFRGFGYLCLFAINKFNSHFPSRLSNSSAQGLTLLIRAKKA